MHSKKINQLKNDIEEILNKNKAMQVHSVDL